MRSLKPGLMMLILALQVLVTAAAAEGPTCEEAEVALRKAVEFFHGRVAVGGGYVWRVSSDLALREGEGDAGPTRVWVQPPGTPTVGEAFLDAYDATHDDRYLASARDAAGALLAGQMRSGGWHYAVEFDPEKRKAWAYRAVPEGPRQRERSTLDDDTTQSAIRFLVRLDGALGGQNKTVREAARYAVDALVRIQRPSGGWPQWWDRRAETASAEDFPVVRASYPDDWPRVWPNNRTGCYYLNDNVLHNAVTALLSAYDAWGDERHLAAVKKAGDFMVLAQMPAPQPAWAQQYDVRMHPVWDRKFEPPAVSGSESQTVLRTLMLIYTRTGDRKYLEPIPRALAYFKRSLLPDGRLARFYELKTNRPLYFKVTEKRYDLTYSDDDLPTHYAFKVGARLDGLEAEYQRLVESGPPFAPAARPPAAPSAGEVRKVIDALDGRGAWTEPGIMRNAEGKKVEPPGGIIESRTFVRNVQTLSRFLAAGGGKD